MSIITRRRSAAVRRFRLGDWMNAPEWITFGEAAQLSGYSIQYVRRTIRQGKIMAEKRVSRDLWIDKASLQLCVKEMKHLGTDKHNPHCHGD